MTNRNFHRLRIMFFLIHLPLPCGAAESSSRYRSVLFSGLTASAAEPAVRTARRRFSCPSWDAFWDQCEGLLRPRNHGFGVPNGDKNVGKCRPREVEALSFSGKVKEGRCQFFRAAPRRFLGASWDAFWEHFRYKNLSAWEK